jgi:hypothetical protein
MTILTATATKENLEAKMGIAFTRAGADSPLVIKNVKEGSIFEGSDLKEGYIVETVMGEPMTWKTPKDAADALRAAEAGEVSISVSVCVGEIVKEEKGAKLGISLKNSTKEAGIFVSKVNEDGAFGGSELAEGQKVLYINDTPCPNDTKKAIALVKEAEGALKIVTSPKLTPPAAADPAPVVEEKKEEEPVTEEGSKKDEETQGEDKEIVSEEDKGLIDKIFATCIC